MSGFEDGVLARRKVVVGERGSKARKDDGGFVSYDLDTRPLSHFA
jgi:hypothetical protein